MLAACGDEAPQVTSAHGACAVAPFEVPPWRRPPIAGYYYAQEVWISWHSKDPDAKGYRYPRKQPEALALARDLCKAARAGHDIGDIARKYSNGDGAVARGIIVTPEDSHRTQPDARDLLLMRTPVGELTPLIEYQGGYWFARRIGEAKARRLVELVRAWARRAARVRVIHIHYADAWPLRVQFEHFTEQQAVQKAWALIREVQKAAETGRAAAEARFIELAKEHSNDGETRKDGGLLVTRHPVTGERTDRVRWGDRGFAQTLLEVILEKAEPGRVWHEPVVSPRGVDVVFVLERDE
jgi:hypothetical protein